MLSEYPQYQQGDHQDNQGLGLSRKRRYQRLMPWQKQVLSQHFVAGDFWPSRETREGLANQLGIDQRKVQIWFQNERAKSAIAIRPPNFISVDGSREASPGSISGGSEEDEEMSGAVNLGQNRVHGYYYDDEEEEESGQGQSHGKYSNYSLSALASVVVQELKPMNSSGKFRLSENSAFEVFSEYKNREFITPQYSSFLTLDEGDLMNMEPYMASVLSSSPIPQDDIKEEESVEVILSSQEFGTPAY
jgi:hypothetical protein